MARDMSRRWGAGWSGRFGRSRGPERESHHGPWHKTAREKAMSNGIPQEGIGVRDGEEDRSSCRGRSMSASRGEQHGT